MAFSVTTRLRISKRDYVIFAFMFTRSKKTKEEEVAVSVVTLELAKLYLKLILKPIADTHNEQ